MVRLGMYLREQMFTVVLATSERTIAQSPSLAFFVPLRGVLSTQAGMMAGVMALAYRRYRDGGGHHFT